MLLHLHVRNLAVIAEASVEFGAGLNVVTGETGAGKSLVVDSLALLAGARASADLIRTGAETCTVTGIFQPEHGRFKEPLDSSGVVIDGDEVVVRRELSRGGRNRVFINDQPVTLRLLSEIGPHLLRIHGQREELGLTTPDLQRQWLDRLGGRSAPERLGLCTSLYKAWSDIHQRLERLRGDDRLRHERIDLLRFQCSEIESAAVKVGEEVELRRRRDLMRNAEVIGGALQAALAELSDDDDAASARLSRARQAVRELEVWQPEALEWSKELEEVQIRVDELSRTMGGARDEVEYDPAALNEAEDRLATLERLFRKYGAASEQVVAHFEEVRTELAELEGDESSREKLEKEATAALAAFEKAARDLSRARKKWAKELVAAISRELSDLALEKAAFGVTVAPRVREGSPLRLAGDPVEFGPYGIDQVVFEFAPNPGEEMRPLARVASGGELARVYLALQVALRGESGAGASEPAVETAGATFVFDEVDAGIGGQEAAAVGRKLQTLGSGGQILAVTHLPQVASFGDQHFRVTKLVSGDRTETQVVALDRDHRVEEIARMLAGDVITDLSREHAEELLGGKSGVQ